MKAFRNFLKESILDPERVSLSKHIFNDDQESLRKDVRDQILLGLAKLSNSMLVNDYTLIGSILTKRYAEDSDVDINVLVAEPDEKMEELRKIAVQQSGSFVVGTTHPINYHLLNDKSDFDNANDSADGVFDISKNRFIRRPIEKPFDVSQYMSKFKKVVQTIDTLHNELVDDLIDYKELKSISSESAHKLIQELEVEIQKIETSAVGLVDLYDKVKRDRADAFARPLTAKDIQKYGVKNRLPENVVYKLLERHYYLHFLQKVKEIVGPDDKLDSQEIQQLSNYLDSKPLN